MGGFCVSVVLQPAENVATTACKYVWTANKVDFEILFCLQFALKKLIPY